MKEKSHNLTGILNTYCDICKPIIIVREGKMKVNSNDRKTNTLVPLGHI